MVSHRPGGELGEARAGHDDRSDPVAVWNRYVDGAAAALAGGDLTGLEGLGTQLGAEPAVDTSPVGYGELFREPLYQLFRLQLLADQMERAGELGADRVRLVLAASSRNRALAGDLRRWPRLLRRPDRFAMYDTDTLLAGSARSDGFRRRYG